MTNQRSLSRKISQELDKLQREITIKLERYYKQKIKGKQVPVDFIRQNDKEIKGIIRDTVQASWLFAHGIISDVTGQRVDITTRDIEGIELTTNNMENYYWAVAHDQLTRETALKVDNNNQLVELEPFNLHAAFVGLGGWFVYLSYNESIKSKAAEVGTQLKLKFITREDCIDSKICLPLNNRIFDIGTVPFEIPLHKHCHCKLIPVLV